MEMDIRKNKMAVLLLLTGAVYFFLKKIVPLVAPVLLAMLFVTIFGSFLQKLQVRLRIHRQIGAILILMLACGVTGLLLWVLFSWILSSLPRWVDTLDTLEKNLGIAVHRICVLLGKTIRIDNSYLEELLIRNLQDGLDWVQSELIPGMLSQSLGYVKTLAAFGAFLAIFLIATVLLAKDYDDIMNRMLNREDCRLILEVICGVIRYLATFVKAQAVIMSCIGVLVAVVLRLCNIPQGVLWGILAGLLDALPFIGTGIVLVPLAIQQFFLGKYKVMIFCILLYVTCIFIREFLEPKLIGKNFGVPPIAILLSIYAGVQLFGIWGIVEGPLGFVMIRQAYYSFAKD